MPNWCEGNLKMRGMPEDIVNCLKEYLVCHSRDILNDKFELIDGDDYPAIVEINEDCEISAKINPQADGCRCFWIKDSRRHFLGDSSGIYDCMDRTDGPGTVLFEGFKAAWSIDEEPFRTMSEKYNIDIRIEGFECGMEFSQILEIIRGKVTKNESVSYDDWKWECICPNLGG